MALKIDTSPVREFVENLASHTTPAIWAWQVGVVVAAIGLAWLLAHAACKRVQPSERWKFGEGRFESVIFPVFAYLFLVVGRLLLARYQPVALLDIVASILVAAIGLRLAVYVLGHILKGALFRAVIRALAWIAWIAVVLHVTGLLPEVIQALDDVGFETKGNQRISVWLIAQGVAALGLTLAVAMWIARITEGRVMATKDVDLSTRVVVSKLIRVAAAFIAVLIALPLVGIDITALSIFGGALGVGLGFGLQKIAANYVSGFIVLLDRSLRIGDTVTVDNRRGEVKEIASRYTVIRGGDGTESIIPNEKLITEVVNHHTYSDPKLAIPLPVTVAYDADIDAAFEVLLAAARRHAKVIDDPAPVARIRALGEYGILLELTLWTADPGIEGEVRSDVYRAILGGLRAAGIQVAYPRRDVHLHPTGETPETT